MFTILCKSPQTASKYPVYLVQLTLGMSKCSVSVSRCSLKSCNKERTICNVNRTLFGTLCTPSAWSLIERQWTYHNPFLVSLWCFVKDVLGTLVCRENKWNLCCYFFLGICFHAGTLVSQVTLIILNTFEHRSFKFCIQRSAWRLAGLIM